MNRIYLDYNATTPVEPAVLDAMLPYFSAEFGNAASIHTVGQRARAAVETARDQVAALLGARAQEIVFTSGGTESDNHAIFGIVRSAPGATKHVITTNIEHEAVLNTCQALKKEGVAVTYLPVHALELLGPDLPHVLLAPDAVAHGRVGAEEEERRVVVAPRGGELHDGPERRVDAVGQVRVERVAVVDEAVLLEELHGVLARIRGRRPRAKRLHAQDLLEDVQALHEQLFFLFPALESRGPLVQIAVLAHLVAALDDLLAERRVTLDDPAGDEDARLDVVAVQEVEDARHAGLRAVGAHRHVEVPVGEGRIALDPRGLAVEVERHHDRAAGTLGPGHGSGHGAEG